MIAVIIGGVIGGTAGYLIDTIFTSDPYIGVRVGFFLGAILGGQVGGGGGLRGVGALMTMLVCMSICIAISLLIWPVEEPNSGRNMLQMIIAAIPGGYIGLIIGVRAFKPKEKGTKDS